jgi:hypothetical protein
LAFLILVQVYWFIGITWRTDLEDYRDQLDRIAGQLRELNLQIQVGKDLTDRQSQQISKDSPGQTDTFFIDGSDDMRANVKSNS